MTMLKNYSLYDWQIYCYDTVDSTNDLAASDKTLPTDDLKKIFIAKTQTNGRGRRGRSWISPQGNLYMSQLINWHHPISELVYISSLSIAQSLSKFAPDIDFKIKWPNDILLNGAKLCGILIEKNIQNNVIIGIGINLQSSPSTDEVIYPTTNLANYNCNITVEDFLNCYLPIFTRNCSNDFTTIKQNWLKFAYNLGQTINIKLNTKNSISGRFIGIDEQGNLLLEQKTQTVKITTGEIIY